MLGCVVGCFDSVWLFWYLVGLSIGCGLAVAGSGGLFSD